MLGDDDSSCFDWPGQAASTSAKQTSDEKSNASKDASGPQSTRAASNNEAGSSSGSTKDVQVQGASLSAEQRTKVTQVSQSIDCHA